MDVDDIGFDPPIGARTIDIELGAQDVVTIDLDNLDPNTDDILDLLQVLEGPTAVWTWLRFAGEYWRKGLQEPAEKICDTAIETFKRSEASLWAIYAFKANISLSHARRAPKMILSTAKRDVISDRTIKTKDNCHKLAASYLNETEKGREVAGEGDAFQILTNLTRAVYLLSTRSLDQALQSFNNVLASRPTNIPALLGKARVYYARREYPNALHHFQRALQLSPACKPDPRIGIGLCLWAMGKHEKARSAWERSIEVNPNDWAGHVILGLDELNRSKEFKRSDEERSSAYASGTKHIEKAFRANNKSAAAANALSPFFLRKGDTATALKLAERTVQFADTLALLSEGHLRIARTLQSEGSAAMALSHYQAATEGQQKNALASLGLAQMQLKSQEVAAAINTLDTLISALGQNACLEARIMLASLRANPRAGVSSAEIVQDKVKAREMFDHIVKVIESHNSQSSETGSSLSVRHLGENKEMFVEMARLWQHDSPEKMSRALNEALRIAQSAGETDARITNNLGALRHMDGDYDGARSMYEEALGFISQSDDPKKEEISTTVLYNLARVYEAQKDTEMAREAYSKLLKRHPEYIDARIRQAQMLRDMNRIDEAHEQLKQALASQSNNPNLRAYYTYFLMQSHMLHPANNFVQATMKDHDRHDIYALCAGGLIHYTLGRDSHDKTPEGQKSRRRSFERAVEFYQKALSIDSTCAIAAQGLAIVTAEDVLNSSGRPDDGQRRSTAVREALDVFTKVRETVADGSVYANMGHCYYARDEFERAIECYETASKRFYNQQDVPVLLCLARTNYAKANKDQSYPHMGSALEYAQKACHLKPSDKAAVYNIALIQQKAAEMLFAMDPSRRTLQDLRKGIEHAEHAQSLFASLASDKSPSVTYSRDIADQRRKYGESMLRKADEHIATQESHEAEVKEKQDAARQRRLEERERVSNLERQRMDQLRVEAEELADQRRKAREEAIAWTQAAKAESDEEKERKLSKKSKKSKAEVESGDEASGLPGEPKKKRKPKVRKPEANGEVPGEQPPLDQEEALFSGDEDEKPKKRVPKKRVIRDDDDDDETAGPRKKLIKSKEIISDSDEGMD